MSTFGFSDVLNTASNVSRLIDIEFAKSGRSLMDRWVKLRTCIVLADRSRVSHILTVPLVMEFTILFVSISKKLTISLRVSVTVLHS